MNNKLERLLLAFLLGISILLGLSFWLNTFFGFNLFLKEHWNEVSHLQAEQVPIADGFYVSIGFALFLFVFGLYLIYMPALKRIYKKTFHQEQTIAPAAPVVTQEVKEEQPATETTGGIPLSRPPRLNLPKNTAKLAAAKHEEMINQPVSSATKKDTQSVSPYNSILAQIFTDAGFTVKTPSVIAKFTPNLFAIGPNEVIWLGAVDADMNGLTKAITELDSIIKTSLDDVEIYINAFMIDTMGQQQPNDFVMVFKSVDELKTFVQNNPADKLTEDDQENFAAYSEYIDTILQYVKNI